MIAIQLLTILNEIQQVDNGLLTLVNFDGSTAYDMFWMNYTNGLTWTPLAVVVAWCLLRMGGWRHALLITAVLCLLFMISDFFLATVIKPWVARPRPAYNEQIANLLSFVNNYRGGRFGFPSNHASNGFAIATMLTLIFRRPLVIISAFLWAIGSCYSRMYLAVHYPTDILTGAVFGTLTGLAMWFIYKKAISSFLFPAKGEAVQGQASDYSAVASSPYVDGTNHSVAASSAPWGDKRGATSTLLIPLTFFATVVVLLLCSLALQSP